MAWGIISRDKKAFFKILNFGGVESEFFLNAWEVKKSKFENIIKWEPIISQMMRGFQIWPQNSNRTTFDLILDKKLSNIGILENNPIFDSLSKKGVKCLIWILRPDLGSSCHLWYNRPHLMIFEFSFFDLQKNSLSTPLKFWKNCFFTLAYKSSGHKNMSVASPDSDFRKWR